MYDDHFDRPRKRRRLSIGISKTVSEDSSPNRGMLPLQIGNTDSSDQSVPTAQSVPTVQPVATAQSSFKTCRVRGIPSNCKLKDVKNILQTILKAEDPPTTKQIRSLALSPDRKTKTATVDFESLPTCLHPGNTQWAFELPEGYDTNDSEDEDDIISGSPRITIDTHFKGLTILRSFKNVSDHKIE